MDRMSGQWHPEIEWDLTRYSNWDVDSYRGPAESLEFFTAWMGSWSSYTLRVEKRPPGRRRRGGGAPLAHRLGARQGRAGEGVVGDALDAVDGRARRVEFFSDRAEAGG